MLAIGDKEIAENAVSVRSRKDGEMGKMSVEEFAKKVQEEMDTFAR